MGVCIRERDYLDFIEHRLGIRRSILLTMHAFRCTNCRKDLFSWPRLRRIVRRSDQEVRERSVGLAENVMERIRCVR